MKKRVIPIVLFVVVVLFLTGAEVLSEGMYYLGVLNSPGIQIWRWKEANEKYNLEIPEEAFGSVPVAPKLTEDEKFYGFTAVGLFYGFGDDGEGNADILESARKSWEVAEKVYSESSKGDYIKFERGWMRLRPGAPSRPRGFYWKKIRFGGLGREYESMNELRKVFFEEGQTGVGAEAFQLIAIIAPEYVEEERNSIWKLFEMSIADIDIAPEGDFNFYGVPAIAMDLNDDRLCFHGSDVTAVFPRNGLSVLW